RSASQATSTNSSASAPTSSTTARITRIALIAFPAPDGDPACLASALPKPRSKPCCAMASTRSMPCPACTTPPDRCLLPRRRQLASDPSNARSAGRLNPILAVELGEDVAEVGLADEAHAAHRLVRIVDPVDVVEHRPAAAWLDLAIAREIAVHHERRVFHELLAVLRAERRQRRDDEGVEADLRRPVE